VGTTLPPPRDLTIPEPGSTTARGVLSLAIGRLARELVAMARAPSALALSRADGEAFARLVLGTAKNAPGALASALRKPTVGTFVRCLRSARGAGMDRSRAALLATSLFTELALELASMDALSAPVRLERVPAELLSLSAGLAVEVPPDTVTTEIGAGAASFLRRSGERVRVDLASGEGPGVSRPYLPVRRTLALALADHNPLALTEAHPDKRGNAIDLGGEPVERWCESLASALDVIEEHLPELAEELHLFVQQLVPVGFDAEKHLSASYQEAIGTVYLSLHPSAMTMVEALVHEFSHNKINALFELDDVLENAWRPLYASPVRPDPRPLHGVLLAVHAFLPVARLYERMIAAGDPLSKQPGFSDRFDRIRGINRQGAEVVLENGRPTAVGAGVLDEIRRWDEYFAR
jgi:HEXXH motif-containing protein